MQQRSRRRGGFGRIGFGASAALAFGLGLAWAPTQARADDQAPPTKAPAAQANPKTHEKKGRDEATIRGWIQELGSDSFDVREKATKRLGGLPATALPLLEAARKTQDPEVRWRIEKAIASVRARAGSRAAKPGAEKAAPEDRSRADARRIPGAPGLDLQDPFAQIQKELERMQPGLGKMLRGFPIQELFPKDFEKAFEEMDRVLRGFDRVRPGTEPNGSRVFRSWKTFRFKDGKWTIEEGGTPLGGAPGGRRGKRIGLRTGAVPELVRDQLDLGDRPALAVEAVQPGSLAADAGLRAHDLVLRIDGLPVQAGPDLEILQVPGTHRVEVLRKGRPVELSLETPKEAPAPKKAPAPGREEPKKF